ncbi:alpha/beta fold hydrolase [Pleionea sediminis]|uniref:alpha/beta fold hydrolase n=1 Tax=Pleionea sediminis TaxID=2569479 RepID=UPI001185F9BA|nr:alpha/beta fold hydrolase [Pleionea sediminis]
MNRRKFFNYFLFNALIMISSLSSANGLKPRGFLGIGGQPVDGSDGIVISNIAPNSTATQLGLQQGDRVTLINGQTILSFQDVISVLGDLREGDSITVKLTRDGQTLKFSGALSARQQEVSDAFNVISDSVTVNNNRLRSYIYQPKDIAKNEKRPALFYIQGYTCGSVNWGALPNLTMRQLLSDIAKAGFVVYRVEKFGVGDSDGHLKCSQIDFTTELSGFDAAIKALKALPYVDENNIHLFGHSLGGLYAPLIAEKNTVKSVAVYGTVVKPWYEYLLDIYSKQALLYGTDKKTAQKNRDRVQPLLDAWLNSDRSLEAMRHDEKLKDAFNSNLVPINGDQIFHRHYTFFRDQNQYNFAAKWKALKVPTLAIHGEYDVQAIDDSWTHDVVNAVNSHGRDIAKRVIIPKTEHSLMTYKSREATMSALSNGQNNVVQPGEHYKDFTYHELVKWLKQHSG